MCHATWDLGSEPHPHDYLASALSHTAISPAPTQRIWCFQTAYDAMEHVIVEAHHVGSREGKQWC